MLAAPQLGIHLALVVNAALGVIVLLIVLRLRVESRVGDLYSCDPLLARRAEWEHPGHCVDAPLN